jgi:hypothetical protein
MSEYVVALEPWTDAFWAEMEPLANDHFHEVDGDVEPNRPFELDLRLMKAISDAGALMLISARKAGTLIGYFTWNIAPDVESRGLLIGQQGAWYVRPGHPRIAAKMFHVAIAELKARGVQCVFPHHRTQGRGANIGRFFKRRGAKDIQRTYCLWIGD